MCLGRYPCFNDFFTIAESAGKDYGGKNLNMKKINHFNDSVELRNLIISNPDLPLLVFCGEDSWSGEYPYELADINSAGVKELTLYKDYWMDKDEYEDQLVDDLCNEEKYKNLSDEEYTQMIKEKVAETEFVKAIIIYAG